MSVVVGTIQCAACPRLIRDDRLSVLCPMCSEEMGECGDCGLVVPRALLRPGGMCTECDNRIFETNQGEF